MALIMLFQKSIVFLKGGEYKMTNYEKYRDEIVKSNYTSDPDDTFCNKFIDPKVLKSMGRRCSDVKCDHCRMLMSIWLMDEYKEPEELEVDWSKVLVDTKIYVKDSEKEKWHRRYFAKYENGKVYVWNDGLTSWSAYDENCVVSWKYAKLAEEANL